ncbi:major facilitator superfamily domain-containing protein [Leucosporidium creatinivorum]|uniref:Major facilitator superfamily domain-containing protein n=1 Tax=Leucosporidium creatinivorum TaxID=106004 RepID=A0A1Y2G6W6_9BASI|nr:major facilitator superfamily domain-containing protein [Leucosporidium creatinivorum]
MAQPIPLEAALSLHSLERPDLRAGGEPTRAASQALGKGEQQQGEGELWVEGGIRGWCNCAGAFLVLLCTFGYAASFGVYQSYYQLNQYNHLSASTISWIGSTALGIEFCFAFVAGPLFDRGYFRILMITGSVGFAVCVFMTSLCHSFWQSFLTQAIGLGISMGLVYIPSVSVLNHYFLRRRALAMGIAMSGASLGGIVFPIMLNHLFASIGFAAAVRASGYVIVGGLILANLLMSSRYPPAKHDEFGIKKPRPSAFRIWGEPRYFLTVIGTSCLFLGLYFPITYIQVFAETQNLPRSVSDNTIVILNVASFFGRIVPNFLGDTFGVFTLLTSCGAGISVLIFALYGATNSAGLIIIILLFGFFSGGVVALTSPLLIATADDISEIGVRQGHALVFNGLAALVCTPISGALLAAGNDDFKYAIAFAGAITMLGAVTMLGARHFQARQLGTWKV